MCAAHQVKSVLTIATFPFLEKVLAVVNSTRLSLMPDALPQYLYHYTNASGFIGIATNRNLRAGSAVLLQDKSEIRHGVELLAQIVDSRLAQDRRLRTVSELVLKRIQIRSLERIDKTYVACFCQAHDLKSQWDRYGAYCLRFPVYGNSGPLLRPCASGLFMQFIKVVYDDARKRSSLTRLVEQVTGALEDQTNFPGNVSGPWTKIIADAVAGWVSELVLDVLVSFKSDDYSDEMEWRLVVRPKYDPGSTDRISPDRYLEAIVKNADGKKYVELFAHTPLVSSTQPGRPPIPFDSVTVCRCKESNSLRGLARRILNDNSRPDISINLSQTKL